MDKKNKVAKAKGISSAILKKKKPSKGKKTQDVVQIKKIKRKHTFDPIRANRGVVYISHLPHGFYEDQLNKYFSQFGEVTRVKVARSQTTGKSKGYGFVEFRMTEVAEIAAETMDNYLMFKKILKTVYVPPEKQKFNLFQKDATFVVDSNGVQCIQSEKTKRIDLENQKRNADVTDAQHQKRLDRAMYKLKKQQEKFAAMNIPLDLNGQIVGGNLEQKNKENETKAKKKDKESNKNDAKKGAKDIDKGNAKNKKLTKVQPEKNAGNKNKKQKKIETDEADSDNDVEMVNIKNAKSKLAKKNEKDISLSYLLNDTIQDDDEEDDDDFEPPTLNESDDSEDIDIDEGDSDEEEVYNQKIVNVKNAKTNKKPAKKNAKDISLSYILNETIPDDDDDDDPSFISGQFDDSDEEVEDDESDDDKEMDNEEDSDNDYETADQSNVSLSKILNQTINSDDSSDEDFHLADEDMKEASDCVDSDSDDNLNESNEENQLPAGNKYLIKTQKSVSKFKGGIQRKQLKPKQTNKTKDEFKKAALKELLAQKQSPLKKFKKVNLKNKK